MMSHPCDFLSYCDLSVDARHQLYIALGPPVMPWDKLGMIPVLMQAKHGKQLPAGGL